MALGKSLDNILGDYFGEEVVELSDLQNKDATLEPKAVATQKAAQRATETTPEVAAEETVQTSSIEAKTIVKDIFIDDIDVSPYQTRRRFDPVKLRSLATSIAKSGLIHPILVLERKNPSPNQKPFFLIAGERRLRACQELNYELVLAVVKAEADFSKAQLAMLGAMENLQRENLNPIELAHTFEMLIKTQKTNEAGVASLLDASVQYVKNYLRLLGLEESVQRALEEGVIGEGQARHLVGLSPKEQLQLLDLIVQKDLTVREIQRLVRELQAAAEPAAKFTPQPHHLSGKIVQRVEKFAAYFPDSRIKMTGDDSKGKITVQWG